MSYESYEKLAEEKKAAILKSGIMEFSQKSYADASTDNITKSCSISKGLLFHHFGSKKEFYLYCLAQSFKKLVVATSEPAKSDFYGIIFSVMDEKLRLCYKYPNEMRLVNMASREMSAEVAEGKNYIFSEYLIKTTAESAKVMLSAIAALKPKKTAEKKAVEALTLYINALMNKYLLTYQGNPDEFFEKSDVIQTEMREYIDLMLYGVVMEEKK